MRFPVTQIYEGLVGLFFHHLTVFGVLSTHCLGSFPTLCATCVQETVGNQRASTIPIGQRVEERHLDKEGESGPCLSWMHALAGGPVNLRVRDSR